MSDAVWNEIMKSPLDPDPDEERGLLTWLVPVGVAIVIGLGIGALVGRGETTTTSTLAAPSTTTTTTTTVPPPEPIVPAGYSEAAGIGLKAVAVFNRGDDLFVVVNSAVRSDLDRVVTDEFHVAEWILAGDGVERTAASAVRSDFAPGVRLVEFPNVGALPVSAPELRVRKATEMVVRSGCNGCGATSVDASEGELMIEGLPLPYTMTEPLLIPVGTGINLAIDQLEITEEWAFMRWRIIDDNDARVRIRPRIIFEGTDDPATDDVDPTQLVPASLRGPNQQNPLRSNPDPFTREGTIGLDRVGEIMSAENAPETIVLVWDVESQHPVGDPIVIPLAGIADLGSIG